MKGAEAKYIEVIGEVCMDVLMHYPNSVEVMGEKLWAEDIAILPGGSAVFVAAALAHLGEPVRVCGSLGDDSEGEEILRVFKEINVDCGHMPILKGPSTTRSMVICDGAKKTFLGCSPMLPVIMPSIESLQDTKLIYVAGYMLYKELWTDESFEYFRKAHELGIPIVIDGQWTLSESFNRNPDNYASLFKTMPLCSVFFAALKELHCLKRSDDRSVEAAQLLEMGLQTAVMKYGSQGAAAYTKDGVYSSKGYPVEVYDAVGSGDIMGAAYTYGFLSGWPTGQCIEFANVFAALSLSKYRERKQFPSKETVLNIIKERGVNLA